MEVVKSIYEIPSYPFKFPCFPWYSMYFLVLLDTLWYHPSLPGIVRSSGTWITQVIVWLQVIMFNARKSVLLLDISPLVFCHNEVLTLGGGSSLFKCWYRPLMSRKARSNTLARIIPRAGWARTGHCLDAFLPHYMELFPEVGRQLDDDHKG